MLCRAFGTPETGSTWAIKSIQQAYHAGWLNVTALQTPNDKVCRAVLYESAFAAATIPVYDSVLYDGVILMPYENILRVGAELGLCAANASPLELVTRAEAARLLYALLTQTLTVTEPPIPISLQNCMGVNMNAYLLELRRVPAPILEAFSSEGWTLLLDTKYLAELSRELNVSCIGATCCGEQRIYVSEASAVVHEFGHFLMICWGSRQSITGSMNWKPPSRCAHMVNPTARNTLQSFSLHGSPAEKRCASSKRPHRKPTHILKCCLGTDGWHNKLF